MGGYLEILLELAKGSAKEKGSDYLGVLTESLLGPELKQIDSNIKKTLADLGHSIRNKFESIDPVKSLDQGLEQIKLTQKKAFDLKKLIVEYDKLKISNNVDDKKRLDQVIKDMIPLVNNPALVKSRGQINKNIAQDALDNIMQTIPKEIQHIIEKAKKDLIQVQKNMNQAQTGFKNVDDQYADLIKVYNQYQKETNPNIKNEIYLNAVKQRLINPYASSMGMGDETGLQDNQFRSKLQTLGQDKINKYQELLFYSEQFDILKQFTEDKKSAVKTVIPNPPAPVALTPATVNRSQTMSGAVATSQFKNDMKELLTPISQKLTGITKDIGTSKNEILQAITGKKVQHRASGGSIAAGQLYLVGEEGPELFVSDTNGAIIPNNQLASGGSGLSGGDLFSGLTDVVKNLTSKIQDLIAKISPDFGDSGKVPSTLETNGKTEEDNSKTGKSSQEDDLKKNKSQMLTWSQQMQQITAQTAQAMQQTMNSFFVDAFSGKLKSLGDYVGNFLTSVQQSIANTMTQALTNKVMDWAGELFGLASGGPVNSDQPYIVGEQGPELFVPGAAGMIIPNHQLQGGNSGISNGNAEGAATGGSNVTVNVINQTGTAVDAKQGQAKVTPDGIIIPVILKALETNQMGLRDVLTAAR